MKKIYLPVLFILLYGVINAQNILTPTVISAAGGVGKYSAIQLEWTLGEAAIGTVSQTNRLYTVGFNQPVIVQQNLISKNTINSPIIKVFPNPVKDILTVQIQLVTLNTTKIILSDIFGQSMTERSVTAKISTLNIPLQNLIAGIYFLRVLDTNGQQLSNYKIIKAN